MYVKISNLFLRFKYYLINQKINFFFKNYQLKQIYYQKALYPKLLLNSIYLKVYILEVGWTKNLDVEPNFIFVKFEPMLSQKNIKEESANKILSWKLK